MSVLSKAIVSHRPSKTVGYILDPELGMRVRVDPEEQDCLVTLDIEYIPPHEVQSMISSAMVRTVSSAKRGQKSHRTDVDAGVIKVARKALKGWRMTVEGARLMGAVIDRSFTKEQLAQTVDFTEAEITMLMRNSELAGEIVNNVLGDQPLWFPEREEQEGNSRSGPNGSSDDRAAGTASTDT